MAAALQVNPDDLGSAATAQTEVAAAVSALTIGESISAAGAALAGLSCGSACQQAGATLDAVAGVIATDLSAHAERLTRAAADYRSTDQQQAERLNRIAGR
ncbi:type VII secretion target [Mycolicibacterium thermoresistibile]|jgi:hypothetical protein|uniref:ESX-1 secretion-associated protein n=2 Tax=Mycolicibacterium thermoresistibile TaxID=1797 RepID=G7CCW6_MYCT3|nr:type VII secretion target [Mycolicibacterium thermoresistibile]EHI14126.1 hypothetical protein KEK_04072 [Mycolicibacterium thermoresistibile ATCC 19527]MCV7189806.1 hypothetical protein [Mycolicibacterium thermoresistibile]GAT17573.1 putative uncharacterized protein [Mycolicibacterium thermoresistibile]SNW20730.1 Protein of uncharacterised function (DUF2580) [Mycolicibacterium thermoresistibile]